MTCNLPTAYIIQAIPLYLNYFPVGECIIFIHSNYKGQFYNNLSGQQARDYWLVCVCAAQQQLDFPPAGGGGWG